MVDRTPQEQLERFQNAPDDELIRLLVHDLRGPLSGMISAVTLLGALLAKDDHPKTDQLRELGYLMRRTTDTMRLILDAAIEYDRKQNQDSYPASLDTPSPDLD